MDIKILLLGLLFITVDVFPAYASPVADAEDGYGKQEPFNEKYEAELQENKIDISKAHAKAQAIKAKELMSTANVYSQVTNDRRNYFIEYKKLAQELKEKAKNTKEKATLELASLDALENQRRQWEVKSRESENNGKHHQTQAQRFYANAQEWSRRADASVVAAAVAETEASGHENIARKEQNWSIEMKSKAEEMLSETARNHFTKAKEAEQRAAANKIKVQQHAEEAQRHFQAANALEEQVLRAEVAHLDSLARYIALTIEAEEAANMCKKDGLCASMEEMMSGELNKRAQKIDAVCKIFEKEVEFYGHKAKKHEGEATMYSQKAHEVGSDFVSHSASMLRLATAKEDSEVEHDEERFSNQKLKTMPFVAEKIID